ncbi:MULTISPECIES: hypothetical protein [unclassified Streptomyces]|uniref:hypothetical protein n=1 Tax=unclassified Streptomyces TaxID=2593676 RepID=UPI002B1CFD49|nr:MULTISPECIES: hypothetical protein [unclassified Streptomyces]
MGRGQVGSRSRSDALGVTGRVRVRLGHLRHIRSFRRPGRLSLQRRPERVAVGIQQPVRHAHLRLARRVHLAFGLSEGHKLQQRP